MADATKIIFLHHSVGQAILNDGQLRQQLSMLAANFQLFDHGYNAEGLHDAQGNSCQLNYAIPEDDTAPAGFAALFSQPFTNPPANAFSFLLTYDVIIFKTCFPTCAIVSQAQLDEYKNYYRQVQQVIDRYPEKLFITFTPPPLTAAATNLAEANRARALASWLKNGDFSAGADNLAVFDLFTLLANNQTGSRAYGMLRYGYRRQGKRFWRPTHDSHPNFKANQVATGQLVPFLIDTIRRFQQLRQPASKA